MQLDPALEAARKRKLTALREKRDTGKANELLDQIEQAARSDENLLPLFIECGQHDLTLGEICGALLVVWGEYQLLVWG